MKMKSKDYIEGMLDALKSVDNRLEELSLDDENYTYLDILDIFVDELWECIEALEDKLNDNN